jgi:hypothetical protein
MSKDGFKLDSSTTSDGGFASRAKDIFGSLDTIAKKNPISEKEKNEEPKKDNTIDQSDSSSKKIKLADEFKGRESIFRSPNEIGWPPSRSDERRPRRDDRRGRSDTRRRPPRVPDHVVHPKKYTKYSLSDVSRDQMSDKSNTRAAFDFLGQLKAKDDDDDSDEAAESRSDGKISFKKPTQSKSKDEGGSSNVVKDGVKRVMPECVVGQKRPKNIVGDQDKKVKKAKGGGVQLTLSHLDDDEDDE